MVSYLREVMTCIVMSSVAVFWKVRLYILLVMNYVVVRSSVSENKASVLRTSGHDARGHEVFLGVNFSKWTWSM